MRRRVAALAVIAVVVVLIIVGLYLVSRDDAEPTASDTNAAGEDSAQSGAGGDGADGASDTTETTASSAVATTETSDPASRGRCADDSLQVQVRPAAANFEAGSTVLLYAQITNSGDTTCDRDLNGAPLTFEVYRLDDNRRVWASTDCTKPEGEDVVNLAPNKSVLRQIEWSGRVSQPGACQQRDRLPAEAGSYQVYALVGDVFSPAATFNLTEPS